MRGWRRAVEVIGCVDLLLTLTVAAASSEQIAAADCQRLIWRARPMGDRTRPRAGPHAVGLARLRRPRSMPATSGSRSPDENLATHAPADTVAALLMPCINLNPFDWLGDKAKEGLADGWTAVMISIWSAGLWLLEAVFKTLDRFLTPDLTDPGLVGLHSISLWISLVVAVVIGFAQIGQAAIRRDGTSLATLLVGLAQYGAVATCWVAVYGLLVLASAGLTTGLMHGVLDIDGFAGYPAGAGWPDKVGGTVAATVLGLTSPAPPHPRRLRLRADHAGPRGCPARSSPPPPRSRPPAP